MLDTVRTILIWGFSLAMGWQEFIPLMILGFLLLFAGMCVYNDLLFGPLFRSETACHRHHLVEVIRPLLSAGAFADENEWNPGSTNDGAMLPRPF